MNAILRKFSAPSTSSRSISKIFCWKTLCFLIEILFILAIALYSVIQNAGAAAVQKELHPINSPILDEPGLNLTVLGSLGGPVLDVVVQGNYAFASLDPELECHRHLQSRRANPGRKLDPHGYPDRYGA